MQVKVTSLKSPQPILWTYEPMHLVLVFVLDLYSPLMVLLTWIVMLYHNFFLLFLTFRYEKSPTGFSFIQMQI